MKLLLKFPLIKEPIEIESPEALSEGDKLTWFSDDGVTVNEYIVKHRCWRCRPNHPMEEGPRRLECCFNLERLP